MMKMMMYLSAAQLVAVSIVSCGPAGSTEGGEPLVEMHDMNFLTIACVKDGSFYKTKLEYAANPVTIAGRGRLAFTEGSYENTKFGTIGDQVVTEEFSKSGMRKCAFQSFAIIYKPPVKFAAPAYSTKFICRDIKQPFSREKFLFQGETLGSIVFDWDKKKILYQHADGTGGVSILAAPMMLDPKTDLSCSFAPGFATPDEFRESDEKDRLS